MKDFVGNTIEAGDLVIAPSPYYPTKWVQWFAQETTDGKAIVLIYINSKGRPVKGPLVSDGQQVIKVIQQG